MFRVLYYRFILVFVLLALYINTNAQDFNWQATLPKVNNDGFYKILISPDITSRLHNGFSDLRIYNEKGKEIPYIFEAEKPLSYNDYFVEYKIIEKTEQTFWPYYTRLVIHNPSKTKINNIQLVIRNSDVSKSLKLSGSDDLKNWYSIKDGYRFQAMYSDESTSVIKIIDFPLSNYEYYEILIDDWKNNPINIQKAGYFNTSVDEGKYTIISNPQISQLEKEEEKQSLVKMKFDGKPQINKLTFKIEGPEFYYRQAELQVRDSVLNKRKSYDYFFSTIGNITLSSNSHNSMYFSSLRSNEIYLRISNNDNEPLKIVTVEAAQLNSYLISKLEKDKNYVLKFGDKKLNEPEYDLKYFKENIPKDIKTIKVSDIKSIKEVENEETKTSIHLDRAFIWVAIILVVILLLYMITRMMKDMKSTKET